MSIRQRLKRLEEAAGGAFGCPGCAVRRITLHHEYRLPNGETVTLPPYPEDPPCTCGRPRPREPGLTLVVFAGGEAASREEAERAYAEYAAFHRPWQPNGSESYRHGKRDERESETCKARMG
jgi:hypothetical protein